jgi:porin
VGVGRWVLLGLTILAQGEFVSGYAQASLPALPQQPQAVINDKVAAPQGENIWERYNLFGDFHGLRADLAAHGIYVRLAEEEEVFGNPFGGQRQTVAYEGITHFGLRVDTSKAFGLPGGVFAASGLEVHGEGLSATALGNNALTVSSIEATRGIYLEQLWYEQSLLDGNLAVRVGQMRADLEFISSSYASLFINSTFGWPGYAATDLPGGGPNYPYAELGVRVQAHPAHGWTLLAAAFNGDPLGANGPASDSSGTAFRLHDGVLAIAELQYQLNNGEDASGLSGVYKLGGWYDSDRFNDQPRSSNGPLFTNSLSNGKRAARGGNWSFYAIADQLLWLKPNTKDQGIGVFGRVMAGPGHPNLLNWYADAGVTYRGALPGRDRDTVGLAVAWARFSNSGLVGSGGPMGKDEVDLELTYQIVLAPWWQIQPDVQYIVNPRSATEPTPPAPRRGNALVLGVRTNIEF